MIKLSSKQPSKLPAKPKLPLWNKEGFEEWTNAQLDELDAQLAAGEAEMEAQLEATYDPGRDPWHIVDAKSAVAIDKEISGQLKHKREMRVIRAARLGNFEAVARLANTEELLLLALKYKKAGRMKGEPRKNDYSDLTRWRCTAALIDMNRIHKIWKDKYREHYRGKKEFALAIAARRWGFIDVPIDRPPVDAKILRQRLRRLCVYQTLRPYPKLDEKVSFEKLINFKKNINRKQPKEHSELFAS